MVSIKRCPKCGEGEDSEGSIETVENDSGDIACKECGFVISGSRWDGEDIR